MSRAFRLDRRAALGLLAGRAARAAGAAGAGADARQAELPHRLARPGRARRLLPGDRRGPLPQGAASTCELRPGGPSLNIGQLLLAGRVDMIMSNSFEAFTYVREQAPFFTIASIFQKDPQVLIAHPGSGFDSFEKLKGRPLLISNGSRSTFWPFLRKKYGLCDAQLRPYNFNMAPFLADPKAIQQGFVTSEAYSIAKELGKAARGAADRRRGLRRLPDDDRRSRASSRPRRRS